MTKGPLYSGLEPQLLEVFPDATLVMTHRSHLSTVGSGLRLLECFYKPFTNHAMDPDAYVAGVRGAAEAHMQWRNSQDDDRFIDIPFSASIHEPERVIREIYEYAAEPLGEASLQRMLDWENDNPPIKYGKHVYSLEDYGLTRDRLLDEFAAYEQFNDKLERQWGY